MRGMIAKIFDWGTHASYDDTTAADWLAGLVLVLIAAFLWATVVNHTIREIA